MSAPVIINTSVKHTATIIFFHGLGDTGHGWASAIADIRPPHVKVICPTAQSIPVTLNNGFRMPSWFDLKTLDSGGPEDDEGIKKATNLVHNMIESEIKLGIPSNRIVLGGFSQGGALALYSALSFAKPLAGVFGLSCWMPLYKEFPAGLQCSRDIPILQCHGDCDPIVQYKWGQMTSTFLKSLLSNVEFKTYEGMNHTSCELELKHLKDFITKIIGSSQ